MKKKLLIAACISACFSAKSQLLFVGDGALVHIQDEALVYNGGGVKLDGTAKVNNIGDIMVVTSGEYFDVASTSDFRLKYVSPSIYGQLYIKDMLQNNIRGKINKEYVAASHGATGWQQTGLPFYNYSITELQATLPHINVTNTALNSVGRWNPRTVFKWNNNLAVWDQLTSAMTTSVGNPTDYYILSRRNYEGGIVWNPEITTENDLGATDNLAGTSTSASAFAINTKKKIFKGLPVSDAGLDTTVTLKDAFSGSYGTNGTGVNKYNERYNTYIDDPFVTNKWSLDYGKNNYQYGNPFLTNIDLSLIKKGTTSSDDENAISNLNGIYYYTTVESSNNGVVFSSLSGVMVTFNIDGTPVGDVDKLIIKPMQAFVMKLSSNSEQTLKFNKTRRFAQTARAETTQYAVTAARKASSSVVTKQLGVVLLDSNDKEIGRTYYVVSNEAVTGYAPETAKMQAVSDNTSIFTKEELITGGTDTNTTYGLYINEANEETFKGKKVSLAINNPDAAKIKFLISEEGKMISENNSLSNGKSFYFDDNGTLTRLTSGTTIPVTNKNFTYGLYYEQPNGSLGVNELTNGQTIIAKNGSDYFVRFNKNWKVADIEIYSATGQIIYSAKKVSTVSDYTLPINNSVNALYIVKVKSEKGEIITKKIIK